MDKIDGYKQTKRGPKEILEIYQEYFSAFSCFLSTVLTVDYLKSVAYNMIWRTAGNHLFFPEHFLVQAQLWICLKLQCSNNYPNVLEKALMHFVCFVITLVLKPWKLIWKTYFEWTV